MDLKKWVDYCQLLRKKVIDTSEPTKKYLLANFTGSAQQADIEKRTPVISDFFRIKIDVKAFSDSKEERRGIKEVDFSNNQEVFQAMAHEFDMPYWGFVTTLDKKPLKDYNKKFIWQLKVCNIHCPWCFVDDSNKNGVMGNGARFFSVPEIVDVFEQERKKQSLYMIRPSGGEPGLTPEQWLEVLHELLKRGLEKEVCMQGDTNLTTGHFIKYLEKKGQVTWNLLKKIGEYPNFGLLCSFKGTDEESFLKATGFIKKDGSPNKEYLFLEQERWKTFSDLIEAGIDAYPFLYDPNPNTLEQFMGKGAKKFGDGFYLKTWVLPMKLYGPEKERLEKMNLKPEGVQKTLDENFAKSKEIMQNLIWRKFKLNYQAVPRTGIELKVL